jgi:putative cardiolipin synthase
MKPASNPLPRHDGAVPGHTRGATGNRFRGATCLLLVCAALVGGCAGLPTDYPRVASHALENTGNTQLGQALDPLRAEHPGLSAFHPLGDALDAFVARLAFAAFAERSIDLQYYLFHDDLSGRAMTRYLLDAADRGVRVRILLDDMDMGGRDAGLAALALHPKIQLRLFNPFPSRTLRYVNFLTHFGTVTRRMHNKTFIVDNQVAIVGGRNIGDEYFAAADDTNFGDMDVLAAGPIVSEVSASFDRYWNSELAYPVAALGAAGDPALLARARDVLAAETASLAASSYGHRLRASNLAQALAQRDLPLYWAPARLLCDLPEKVLADPDDRSTHLGPELDELLRSARRELLAVSPYFVPGKRGTALLTELAARGVRVTIVTNSLASTDVPAVHAGYARYRRRLVAAGIELYEMRPTVPLAAGDDRDGGGSQESLHAKTFAIDGEQVIVGSMNLDPRSDLLNTELGIVIDSPALAGELADWRDEALPAMAWRISSEGLEGPEREDGGRLLWISREGGEATRYPGREPEAGFARRLVAALVRLLPVEQQL